MLRGPREPKKESLRAWFVLHFVADMIFALPLFIAPRWFLSLLGWPAVDPIATRLVAAALLGIGIQLLIGRDEDAATFRALLNLKVHLVRHRDAQISDPCRRVFCNCWL